MPTTRSRQLTPEWTFVKTGSTPISTRSEGRCGRGTTRPEWPNSSASLRSTWSCWSTEATGKFHHAPHRSLCADGFKVAVVNPLRSRLFAEAISALAKTEGIDERVLALVGERLVPDAVEPPSEAMEALRETVRTRQDAQSDRTALLSRLGSTETPLLRRTLRLAGKPPKLALTAVMRKLVVPDNTLIKEDRLSQPSRT
jgi:hypothetical protein